MNTFITSLSIQTAATILDPRRCFKQALECQQILTALKHKSGWYLHPAVQQWRDNEIYLSAFGYHCAKTAKDVYGYRHSLQFTPPVVDYFPRTYQPLIPNHQRYLVHKSPEYYRAVFPFYGHMEIDCLYIDPDNLRPFKVVLGKRVYVENH